MASSLAPGLNELAQAYRAEAPELAGHQRAEGLAVDGQGVTLLCAANPDGKAEQTCLMRLNHDGEPDGERRYGIACGSGRAIAASSDGYVIAGEIRRGSLAYEACLLRLDRAGEPVAFASFGGPGVSTFGALAVSGDLLVASGSTNRIGWLIAVDPALHARWDRKIDRASDVPAIAAVPGRLVSAAVIGRSTTSLGTSLVQAFDAAGQPIRQAAMPESGEPAGLSLLADDGIALVGHRTIGKFGRIWAARLDRDGHCVWQHASPVAEEQRGRAIVALPDGRVLIAGDAMTGTGREMRAVCLSAPGEVLWQRDWSDGGYNDVRAAAAAPDGDIYLAGSTTADGSGRTRARILRIGTGGRTQWDKCFGI